MSENLRVPLPEQTHTVQYGPPGRYFVRREFDREPTFIHDSKSVCIAEAERANGWPITGSEDGYSKSRERAAVRKPQPDAT